MDRPVEILLVEDNEADIRLTREGIKEAKIRNNLHVVRDGEEAMDFLNKKGDYRDVITPDLILLDLNLPKKDGREVLEEIKNDDRLALIPVVVLTTSEAEKDIVKSYKLHANCYVTKPMGIDQFVEVITAIENFWFTIVKLPTGIKGK
ncbi:response regulator [Fodinibius sediminis]|uniref:Response regulator receiver domain-containing protein n=1 Tax=Fodinibius sediminis TaxID=1214077 RepID=A0A521D1K0_9BACT|nr:response regulator [Fodinibius sediminis]SMO64770.1 Response regulator receiver domain-containing protein [Fodinibius sediminis]